MCGIFGYVGKRNNAAQIILDGLKLQEYRGYDSWGIAVKDGKKIALEKHVGKIGEAQVDLPNGTMGIGHTRWATHGGVTVANAHPHLDCNKEIAVIHNGIVENFTEIKDELIRKGHVFLSDTDTEVIPHLIEDYLKTEGFSSAVRDAFNRLSGLNAIVVACIPSQEIVAAKIGSPLVIGVNDDGLYVASDALGIINHTKKLIFLKDYEMAILGKQVQLITLPHGTKKEIQYEIVDWKLEKVNKGNYKYFMLKEINEQANIIRNIAGTYTTEINKLAEMIKNARGTFFIGAGTAFHAGLIGTYFFSKFANVHVNTAVASEFNYLEDFLTPESLVIALTQSGETIDVVEPLARAKQKGSTIVALVNTLGSKIGRAHV
jgi:glutamine---fructose-6-phosphate transaminase (isomerizing)